MSQSVSIKELQEHAAEIFAQLTPNQELVVEDAGKPVGRIAAMPATTSKGEVRVPGLWKDQVWIADDFDAPLPDSFWLGES